MRVRRQLHCSMTKKKGAVGRLERPGEREFYLRRHLMTWYAALNSDFMAGLSAILERYRGALAQLAAIKFPGEIMSYYWYPWHAQGWAKARAVANGWLDLRGYPEELEALADRWGLRCDWVAPWLHACLMQCLCPPFSSLGFTVIPFHSTTDVESLLESVRGKNAIHIEVTYHPWPPVVLRDPSKDWKEIDWKQDFIAARQKAIEEAVSQLEQQMDEIDRRCLNRGYIHRYTAPELMNHMRWLYHRIALKKVPRQIALEECVGQDAVEKAIYQLARALSLRLPRNRGASVRR